MCDVLLVVMRGGWNVFYVVVIYVVERNILFWACE